MCCLSCFLFILYHAKGKYCFMLYIFINIMLLLISILLAFFFGRCEGYGRLQGNISYCPIILSISYLLGFNLGMMFFLFRTSKQKSKLPIMQILKYQSFRIFISILSLSICIFVYLYFILLESKVS
jgi:hypothetical protein